MDLGDAGELVSLGADIVKLGAELKGARLDLAEAQARVAAIEAQLQPKLIKHAELLQKAVGQLSVPAPLAPVQLAPAAVGAPAGHAPPAPPAGDPTKNRIKDFLKTRVRDDDSISANDVADALKVDAALVRDVMREIRTGR